MSTTPNWQVFPRANYSPKSDGWNAAAVAVVSSAGVRSVECPIVLSQLVSALNFQWSMTTTKKKILQSFSTSAMLDEKKMMP
jgi:hypothetical protein